MGMQKRWLNSNSVKLFPFMKILIFYVQNVHAEMHFDTVVGKFVNNAILMVDLAKLA